MTEHDALLADLQTLGLPKSVADGLGLRDLRMLVAHERMHRALHSPGMAIEEGPVIDLVPIGPEGTFGDPTTDEIYPELLRLTKSEPPH